MMGIMMSCKGNGSAKKGQSASEADTVEQVRIELEAEVMAQIDSLAELFSAGRSFMDFKSFKLNLTEEEKMIKPDYLLDPSVADTLVTKNQKIGAMAILVMEHLIRNSYDMPVQESEEAISRLAASLNFPVLGDKSYDTLTTAERIRRTYEISKENGILNDFWAFESATQAALFYLISQDTELFANKCSDERLAGILTRANACAKALNAYAPYDKDIADRISNRNNYIHTDEWKGRCTNVKDFAQLLEEQKENMVAIRNYLIK